MDNVYCTPEMKKYIAGIDLIVFDIDGVLINTMQSFISTIVVTTQYYINNILRIDVDLNHLSKADAMKFKEFTGFNNDWELTEGMIIYQLFLYKSGLINFQLADFLKEVDEAGGGLSGINAVVKKYCNAETITWLKDKVDGYLIRKTFQEFYGGEEYCDSLYGFAPQSYKGKGSVESEIILLDTALISGWNGAMGILTGRTKEETELALKKLQIADINRNLVQYNDDILPDKPHPEKIVRILHNADSNAAIYIGDSIDDYLTVFNYNKYGQKRRLRFGLVAERGDNFPDDARNFMAESVNPLIEFIINNNKRVTANPRSEN